MGNEQLSFGDDPNSDGSKSKPPVDGDHFAIDEEGHFVEIESPEVIEAKQLKQRALDDARRKEAGDRRKVEESKHGREMASQVPSIHKASEDALINTPNPENLPRELRQERQRLIDQRAQDESDL